MQPRDDELGVRQRELAPLNLRIRQSSEARMVPPDAIECVLIACPERLDELLGVLPGLLQGNAGREGSDTYADSVPGNAGNPPSSPLAYAPGIIGSSAGHWRRESAPVGCMRGVRGRAARIPAQESECASRPALLAWVQIFRDGNHALLPYSGH